MVIDVTGISDTFHHLDWNKPTIFRCNGEKLLWLVIRNS